MVGIGKGLLPLGLGGRAKVLALGGLLNLKIPGLVVFYGYDICRRRNDFSAIKALVL